jgi:hypothetical protein
MAKEYACIKLDHHDKIGKAIQEWASQGWRLHTYQAAGLPTTMVVNHYLLFERG